VGDIDTAVVDSLKVLDPKRPIREADIAEFWREMARSRLTHQRQGVCIAAQMERRQKMAPYASALNKDYG
jgi:hypothetical protein